MQNTEVHKALPAPSLPCLLPAKYIKGGALVPQNLRAENRFFIFTVTYAMLALHLSLRHVFILRPVFFRVLSLKQHFLYSTHRAVKGKYCFLHLTCWQSEMCSFPHSFKKRVGSGEVPTAIAVLYPLPLLHPAFAASDAACPRCLASAATLPSAQLQKGGLGCLRLGSAMQLGTTCENPRFHGTHSMKRQPQREVRRGPVV